MFYTFIRYVAAGVVWLINGRYTLTGQDKLPQKQLYFSWPTPRLVGPNFLRSSCLATQVSMARRTLQESILRWFWFTPMLFPLIVKNQVHQHN